MNFLYLVYNRLDGAALCIQTSISWRMTEGVKTGIEIFSGTLTLFHTYQE